SLAAGARTAHAPTEKRTHANRQVSDRLKSCPCICKYTCIYKFIGLILVRRMHALPFGAKFTDALLEHLRLMTAACHRDEPEMLPSLSWCAYKAGPRAGTWNLALHFLSRRYMKPNDIFTVEDISIHIEAHDRQRREGRFLH